MIGIEEQIELFKLIGRELKKRTECFIIGGSAMLFYGLKSVTKDVDVVFTTEEERERFLKVLEKTGFRKKECSIFKYGDTSKIKPILMERKETRFDLFLNEVITTKLSPGIINRIREKHEFSNLIANIVSSDDIIFLKCATDREGDRKDAADIINSREVNWEIIVNESKWQTENGKKMFTVFLFDFVMELREKYKIEMPLEIIKKITKNYEEDMVEFLKSRK